jgi:hypothetical protein
MIIRFTPEADAELAAARQWYAHQRENLGIEFMERIDRRSVANRSQSKLVSNSLQNAQTRGCSALSFRRLL